MAMARGSGGRVSDAAPKGGRGRGRGAGAKASAKGKKAQAAVPVPAGAIVPLERTEGATSSFPECCPNKAYNAKVMRLYTTKLKKYPRDELKKLQSKTDKLSVHAYLYNGVSELSGSRKHLSSEFWTIFFREFGLASITFNGLSELSTCEEPEIRGEILEALLEARKENPTERRTAPLTNWLCHNDGAISQDEFILILNSSLPDDRVTQKMSEEMLNAIHKYIGKHGLHTKYSAVWGIIKEDMDALAMRGWASKVRSDDERSVRRAAATPEIGDWQ